MKIIKFIDSELDSITSIIYRIVVTLYFISFIFFAEHYFNKSFYIAIVISYILFSFLLARKYKLIKPYLIISDFIHIGVITYGQPMDNSYIYFLITLPLLNSLRKTNKYRITATYLFALLIITIFGFTSNENFKIELLIPIFAIGIFGTAGFVRGKFNEFTQSITSILDEFFTKKIPIQKVHRSYRLIINKINKDLGFLLKIDFILCIQFKDNNKPIIINASKFIFNIQIDDDDFSRNKEITKINKILIDDKLYKNVFLLKSMSGYYFVISFEKNPNFIVQHILFSKTLIPLFIRIAQYLEVEYEIKQIRQEKITRLRKDLEFIEAADLALHFIKNKLQPISTFIDISTEIENRINNKCDYDDLLELYYRERKQAISTRKNIIDKAEKLLEQKRNMNFHPIDKISLGKLFSIVRQIWDEENIECEIYNEWDNNQFGRLVDVSLDGLYLVVDEITNNLKKHMMNESYLSFTESTSCNKYIVTFSNDYKQHHKSKVIRAVDAINTDYAEEVFERTSSGIIKLKRICKQMNTHIFAQIQENFFCVSLYFSPHISREEDDE